MVRLTEFEPERATFQRECARFRREHPSEHVVIVGDVVVGFRSTEDDAIRFGFEVANGPHFFTSRVDMVAP